MLWLNIPVFVPTSLAENCPEVSLKYPVVSGLQMIIMPFAVTGVKVYSHVAMFALPNFLLYISASMDRKSTEVDLERVPLSPSKTKLRYNCKTKC